MAHQLITNALTIDLEDYFQVSNFASAIPRERWDFIPVRVEASVRRLLDLLARYEVKATFFVLGWIAERMGALVREIGRAGHEIASHGHDHRIAYEMSAADFRADVRRAKLAIEDASGERVIGFRATSYSIVRENLSYLQILAEEGFLYDSSIFPVHHDRYGIPEFGRFPSMVTDNGHSIMEIPPSTFRFLGHNVPIAGGGYLRLFPVRFIEYCIRHINMRERHPAIIYLHPWEIDTGQPRVRISRARAFRHYNNLHRTERKLESLLTRFRFGPVRELLSGSSSGAES